MTEPKRGYRSERRDQQAAATRAAIVEAAVELFARQGYAGTSIAEIARAARVAPQTVYASVGSKADLLLAANDHLDEIADVGPLARQAATSEHPLEVLTVGVRITRQLNERGAEVLRALVSAAAVDAEMSGPLEDGRARHEGGAAMLAGRLGALGALRAGVEVADAKTAIATITRWEIYAMLTRDEGWSFDRAERWMLDSLVRLLLTDEAAEASTRD